jgi:hypothetical protein
VEKMMSGDEVHSVSDSDSKRNLCHDFNEEYWKTIFGDSDSETGDDDDENFYKLKIKKREEFDEWCFKNYGVFDVVDSDDEEGIKILKGRSRWVQKTKRQQSLEKTKARKKKRSK